MGAVTPTPVPYKKLFPLAVIYFIEAFVFTNLFAYVGFMVYDFHLTDDEDKVGYYAGYIGSTFSIAGFLSSFWWGKISDKFGRRPVLVFGCVGGLISNLIFGFSTSLEMAIACRFAAGILNGNVGVVKSYAADICDKTNQVKGVGVMQLGWGLGGILGPLIGGVFSRPCIEFNMHCSEDNLFYKFPYLLPNLFSSAASVLAIITLLIYLPSENVKTKGIELKQVSSSESTSTIDDDTSSGVTYIMSEESGSATLHGKLTREDSIINDDVALVDAPKKHVWGRMQKWWKERLNDENSIFANKTAMRTVFTYSILGASFTMYDEAFPLFAMAKIKEGGLGASGTDIGIVGAINGVAAVVTQLVIFYPVATKLGFVRMYRLGLAIGVIIFANYPNLNLAASNRPVMWGFITIATISKVLCGQFAFSGATALVSNSVSLKQVGSINGFAQSLVALFRAFSPAIAGNLLAWGFSNSYGFPLNQYFIFIIISLGCGISLGLTMLLPRSLDFPYVDSNIPVPGEEKKQEAEKESMLPKQELQEITIEDKENESATFSVE